MPSASSTLEKLQSRVTTTNPDPRVIEMTTDDADDVLESLSSDTARCALRALYEEPRTPSELADRVGTSVQNVHYHLSNLRDAGLVEPVDTVYSSRGNEMTVYGPASDPVVFVGDDSRTQPVRSALSDVVGGLALLAVASLFVQWGAERLAVDDAPVFAGVGPASTSPVGGTSGALAHLVFDVLEPGFVFFTGCLVLAAVAAAAQKR